MSSPDSPPDPETAYGEVAARMEQYVGGLFAPEDEALLDIRRAMEREGLPTIQVPALTGRTIQLLLRVVGARRVLEVGTLAGYSTLWIARALPPAGDDDRIGILTLERDPARVALARSLLDRTDVGERVEIREGDADELLPRIQPDGSYDAVFLDADKEGLPGYLQHARRLLRPGGLLLVDNALWKGRIADPSVEDEATGAIRRSHALVAEDRGWDASVLPVGDGLLVALRRT